MAEAYLFNNKTTASKPVLPYDARCRRKKEQQYQQMQLQFKNTAAPYACLPGQEDASALCFRLFDSRMRQMGVCGGYPGKSLEELFSAGKMPQLWSVTQSSLWQGKVHF